MRLRTTFGGGEDTFLYHGHGWHCSQQPIFCFLQKIWMFRPMPWGLLDHPGVLSRRLHWRVRQLVSRRRMTGSSVVLAVVVVVAVVGTALPIFPCCPQSNPIEFNCDRRSLVSVLLLLHHRCFRTHFPSCGLRLTLQLPNSFSYISSS